MRRSVVLVVVAILAAASSRPLEPASAPNGKGCSFINKLRQVAQALASEKIAIVQKGTDIFKEAVEFGARIASHIPGISRPLVNRGAYLLNAKADAVNEIAQVKIQTILALENATLNVIDTGLRLHSLLSARIPSSTADPAAFLLTDPGSLSSAPSSFATTVPTTASTTASTTAATTAATTSATSSKSTNAALARDVSTTTATTSTTESFIDSIINIFT